MRDIRLPRSTDQRPTYTGKKLIFCEGKTEFYYFDFFRKKHLHIKNRFTDLDVQLVNVDGGGARSVLLRADEFLEKEQNAQKYLFHEKCLVFDMDDPEDEGSMLEIIQEMKRASHDYKLFPSYLTFEVWILMHRALVQGPLSKKEMEYKIKELFHLEVYRKGQKGFIAKVLQDNLEDVMNAVQQAKEWLIMHDALGYQFEKDYKRMNPFTKVYALVEEIVLGLDAF